MDFLASFGGIFFLIFLVCLFLIFRVFWLWYWKIDKVVELLGIMREELMEINENTKGAVK